MDRSNYVARVARGDGLIARFGGITAYLVDAVAPAEQVVAAIESAADAANPGAALAERLAPLVLGDGAKTGPFGAVAPTTDGLLILLRGPVAAQIDTADGGREITGERALTWVDEFLSGSVRRIAVRRSDAADPVAEVPQTDLRRGVVPGGGFVVYPAAAQQVPSQTLITASPTAASPTTTMVRSVVGATEPTAHFGAARAPDRPAGDTSSLPAASAALVSDDGAVYPLDRPYVIGRDPLLDATSGSATPITLQGDPHVSRIHAYVSVDQSGVTWVRDAATPGGTFVAAPGAREWTEVRSGPIELPPGWSLRVGERIFTHRG